MEISTAQLYERLGVSAKELQSFCAQHPIIELAFFGSVIRKDFHSKSDIDILVRLEPDCKMSLVDFVGLEYKFEDFLRRDVDLLTRNSVESSRNWIRRNEILNHSKIIYESRRVLSA
ncbi:MAG: nucleotidyltransferase family protein [Phormidesmis sp.]